MKFKNLCLSMISALLITVSTAPSQASDNGVLGIIIGGAAGGFLGSNIGKGRGQLAATAVGALIGAAIGNEVAENTARSSRYKAVYKPAARAPYDVVDVRPYKMPKKFRNKNKRHGKSNKVIVYKHKVVVVKHLYVSDRSQGRSGRKRFEKRRRQLAHACYDQPRRCAQAF